MGHDLSFPGRHPLHGLKVLHGHLQVSLEDGVVGQGVERRNVVGVCLQGGLGLLDVHRDPCFHPTLGHVVRPRRLCPLHQDKREGCETQRTGKPIGCGGATPFLRARRSGRLRGLFKRLQNLDALLQQERSLALIFGLPEPLCMGIQLPKGLHNTVFPGLQGRFPLRPAGPSPLSLDATCNQEPDHKPDQKHHQRWPPGVPVKAHESSPSTSARSCSR